MQFLIVVLHPQIFFQLDADDAEVTFDEAEGQDVYDETQMPI